MRDRLLFRAGVLGVLVLLGGCRAATASPYQRCAYDSDCRTPSDRCIQVTSSGVRDSMCSSSCSYTDSRCPTDAYGVAGSCISFDGGVRYQCYQTCTTSNVCESGFYCSTVSGSGSARICLPG
ncbi:MAG: hypothetical protein U0234_01450 [Sandaracinus sp.]